MKILQVNKYYEPDVGGVETVCKQHSEFLSDNHDVTVLCVHKNFKLIGSTTKINNVKVIRCSSLGTFFSMPVSLSFYFIFLYQYLKCQVAFFHLPFPLADLSLFLSPVIKRKVILVWHSDIIKQGFLKKILKPILNNSLRKSKKILVTSPNMLKYSNDINNYAFKSQVIPLSVDVKAIQNIVKNSNTLILDELSGIEQVDGLFFGRLCYYKGIEVLLESLILGKKNDFTPLVVIAGRGEYEQVIEDTIKKNDLTHVIFIKRFLTEEEKYTLINKSRCFLFPSVETSEAFGITQLESMCLKVPVINTYLKSGVPWVSQNLQTGLTVDVADSEQLLSAFQELCNDEIYRKSLGLAARERVLNEFDNSIVINKLEVLLRDI